MSARMNRNHGFTLTEIVTTLVIISSLAAMGVPKLMNQMNRMKAQEAAPFLQAIYLAQKDYFRDHNAYATNSNQLDIDVASMNLKYYHSNGAPFDFLINAGTTNTCPNGISGIELGRLQAQFNNTVEISVLDSGRIICEQIKGGKKGGRICPSICPQLGFTECC